MSEEMEKSEAAAKKAWPVFMGWVGNTSALIGLFVTLAGGVAWFINHHRQQVEYKDKLALAQTQVKQGEYSAAVATYGEMLKNDAVDGTVLDQQLNAAMQWAEDFRVNAAEGQSTGQIAAPQLDQILAILDAGLSRSKGSRAADVQAHIGWTHWLNQHIAEREFGPAAQQNFQAALASDPANVYANAMLGNWMLQNGGSVDEAGRHFDVAVKSGKARPFVRELQLSGLVYLDKPGARAALVKAANQMRQANEPLSNAWKTRIVAFCFDPAVTDYKELSESLSALSFDEAWQTYLWLDDNAQNPSSDAMNREFIRANLLELSGKKQDALEAFKHLQQNADFRSASLASPTLSAISRLSRP